MLCGMSPIGNQPEETLGNYLELMTAKSSYEVPHKQSGGAVTAILANALDEGLIDAVVTVTEDRWTLKPSSVVITKSEVLVQQAGSRNSWGVAPLPSICCGQTQGETNGSQLSVFPCCSGSSTNA